MIVAISGTPATGKTMVAKALARMLNWKLVELNELAAQKKLYSGFDEERQCNIVDIEALKKEVGRMKGEDVIIESHYAHDMPCDMVFVLRANPGELRRRMKDKGWGTEKIEENVLAEIMEVCLSESLETCKATMAIDTTGKKPEQVAGEIAKHIEKHKKRSG